MVVKRGWSDAAPHVVFMLLLPFAANVLAERLGVSGILSAVCRRMMQSRVDMLPRQTATRLLNHSVWGLVEFAFNGLVFLILGLQLPTSWRRPCRLPRRSAGRGLADALMCWVPIW